MNTDEKELAELEDAEAERREEIEEAEAEVSALFDELVEKLDELTEAVRTYAELSGNRKPLEACEAFGIDMAMKP